MENIIYNEIITRLKSVEALAAYTYFEVTAPKTLAWFEGQPDQATVEDNNISYPFDCPAIFIQFDPTTYSGAPTKQKAEGEFTLHVIQAKMVDGLEGADSHEDFKTLLTYVDVIIDLLNGYKLECSATPQLLTVERDHVNRPILWEQVKFKWSGMRHIQPVIETP